MSAIIVNGEYSGSMDALEDGENVSYNVQDITMEEWQMVYASFLARNVEVCDG